MDRFQTRAVLGGVALGALLTGCPAPSPRTPSRQETPAQEAALDARGYLTRGSERGERGDQDGAIADLTESLRLQPGSAVAHNNRGLAKARKRDFDGAIADYSIALSLDPGLAIAWNNRGWAKSEKGDHDGAIADCTRSIAVDPRSPWPYLNRGIAHYRKGELDEALADESLALGVDSKLASAHACRAEVKLMKGQPDAAIEDCGRALAIDPRHSWALNVRGLARACSEDWKGAVADYDAAIAADPGLAVAYNNRGAARLEQGELDRCVADCTRAIELDPKLAWAHGNRARGKALAGDLAGGLADVERALVLDPRLDWVYTVRGWIRARQGDLDGGLADFAYVLGMKAQPSVRARTLYERAQVRRWKGDLAGAEADLAEAIRLKPSYATWKSEPPPAAVVARTGAAPAPSSASGNTYVLIVGVNEYEDKRIAPLRFAEADAREVYSFFATDPRSPTSPDRALVLLGKNATRRKILEAIREHLQKKAIETSDTVILYFAGHGFAESSDTYLASSDVDLAALPETAIPVATLAEYWGSIRAGRKVLLVDACHGGGAGRVRGIGGVAIAPGAAAESAGSLTISATGPADLSTEDENLGHGIFTLALLNGLRGAADKNRDGRVSGEELGAFVVSEVPRLAALVSAKQTPVVQGAGAGVFLTR